jgi:anti-sigma-K factor RskA/putative zinc finger protein
MNDGSLHELSAAYALDALDPDDLRAFEAHLSTCERCRAEVGSFRATAATLAYDVDLPPLPETLEHRILAAARAERPNVVPLRRRFVVPAAAAGIAAAAAAVVLGIWATRLSDSLDRERSRNDATTSVINILSDCTRIPAQAGDGSVCVNPARKAVLIADDLPRTDSGKTYEAWVVSGRRPEPAGLFRGGAGRHYLQLTKPVPKGATVGVTLERKGGVNSPTTPMVLRAEVNRS